MTLHSSRRARLRGACLSLVAVGLCACVTKPKRGDVADAEPPGASRADVAGPADRFDAGPSLDLPQDPGPLPPDVPPSPDVAAEGGGPGPADGPADRSAGPDVGGKVGAPCAAAPDCDGLACVDGVCCASPCDGQCVACAATHTGRPDGQCAPVRPGTDPRSQCDQGPGPCGQDGLCDGAGACRRAASGTACGDERCPQGSSTYTAGSTCDGRGTCVAGATSSCGSFQCNAGSNRCRTTCTTSASDCAPSAYCNGSACAARKAAGEPCNGPAECLSSLCGGRCCPDGMPCTCARPSAANLLANPGFDRDLQGWVVRPGPGTVTWNADDYQSCPSSGSARVVASDFLSRTIEQCVAIKPATTYYFYARLRDGGATEEAICAVDLFDAPACAGTAIPVDDATLRSIQPIWAPGDPEPFTTHAAAASARVSCLVDARGFTGARADFDFLYLGQANQEF